MGKYKVVVGFYNDSKGDTKFFELGKEVTNEDITDKMISYLVNIGYLTELGSQPKKNNTVEEQYETAIPVKPVKGDKK